MNCLHPHKIIDGIYRLDIHHPPVAIGWTCTVCRTSGATNWPDASHAERIEAHLAESSRDSASEMMMGKT